MGVFFLFVGQLGGFLVLLVGFGCWFIRRSAGQDVSWISTPGIESNREREREREIALLRGGEWRGVRRID